MNTLPETGFVLFFLCLGHLAYSEITNPKLKVSQKKYWINYVQFSGNIGLTSVRSIVECMALCNHNKQCLSFFYNQELRKCVLHRKLFYSSFAAPETFQQGWKYYSTQDDRKSFFWKNECIWFTYKNLLQVWTSDMCITINSLFRYIFDTPFFYSTELYIKGTETCSYGYTHYRYLEFCFQLKYDYTNLVGAKAVCMSVGGHLSAINSTEKQDFMEHIMGGRPYGPVLIDGEKQQHNEWRQKDGSLLTYFNWYPDEPNGDGNCIQLCNDDKWCDVRCDLFQRVVYCCEV